MADGFYQQRKAETIGSYRKLVCSGAATGNPLEVFLEVSNICDLKCAMCWQFSALSLTRSDKLKSQDRGFFRNAAVMKNIDEILDRALMVHCFGFGEPTISPLFKDIVGDMTARQCMTDFITNGMHLDEALCDFIVDAHVLQITISFSGCSKETYENIYLGGDYERVLAGIRRLAEAKKRRGSQYPKILINSIAFKDHVASFDEFVAMMASAGANVVFLKDLEINPDTPHMIEHKSIMRHDVEGRTVRRAIEVGQRLGVHVDASAYVDHAAIDDADYLGRTTELERFGNDQLSKQGLKYGDTPVHRLREAAERIRSTPTLRGNSAASKAEFLPVDAGNAEEALGIEVREETIKCLEPFKTMYISRNGAVKPCCFSDGDTFLGNAGADTGSDIWVGSPYEAVRRGICESTYPTSCEGCLRSRSAPQSNTIGSLVRTYLGWHEDVFGSGLRETLRRQGASMPPLDKSASEITELYAGRKSSDFDEDWYVNFYSDVASAVASGEFACGRDHFKDFGSEEGRAPCAPPSFDEECYLTRHLDVRQAVESGVLRSGLEHYVVFGRAEGRQLR